MRATAPPVSLTSAEAWFKGFEADLLAARAAHRAPVASTNPLDDVTNAERGRQEAYIIDVRALLAAYATAALAPEGPGSAEGVEAGRLSGLWLFSLAMLTMAYVPPAWRARAIQAIDTPLSTTLDANATTTTTTNGLFAVMEDAQRLLGAVGRWASEGLHEGPDAGVSKASALVGGVAQALLTLGGTDDSDAKKYAGICVNRLPWGLLRDLKSVSAGVRFLVSPYVPPTADSPEPPWSIVVRLPRPLEGMARLDEWSLKVGLSSGPPKGDGAAEVAAPLGYTVYTRGETDLSPYAPPRDPLADAELEAAFNAAARTKGGLAVAIQPLAPTSKKRGLFKKAKSKSPLPPTVRAAQFLAMPSIFLPENGKFEASVRAQRPPLVDDVEKSYKQGVVYRGVGMRAFFENFGRAPSGDAALGRALSGDAALNRPTTRGPSM